MIFFSILKSLSIEFYTVDNTVLAKEFAKFKAINWQLFAARKSSNYGVMPFINVVLVEFNYYSNVE